MGVAEKITRRENEKGIKFTTQHRDHRQAQGKGFSELCWSRDKGSRDLARRLQGGSKKKKRLDRVGRVYPTKQEISKGERATKKDGWAPSDQIRGKHVEEGRSK